MQKDSVRWNRINSLLQQRVKKNWYCGRKKKLEDREIVSIDAEIGDTVYISSLLLLPGPLQLGGTTYLGTIHGPIKPAWDDEIFTSLKWLWRYIFLPYVIEDVSAKMTSA